MSLSLAHTSPADQGRWKANFFFITAERSGSKDSGSASSDAAALSTPGAAVGATMSLLAVFVAGLMFL